jgi:hypothetical protein
MNVDRRSDTLVYTQVQTAKLSSRRRQSTRDLERSVGCIYRYRLRATCINSSGASCHFLYFLERLEFIGKVACAIRQLIMVRWSVPYDMTV